MRNKRSARNSSGRIFENYNDKTVEFSAELVVVLYASSPSKSVRPRDHAVKRVIKNRRHGPPAVPRSVPLIAFTKPTDPSGFRNTPRFTIRPEPVGTTLLPSSGQSRQRHATRPERTLSSTRRLVRTSNFGRYDGVGGENRYDARSSMFSDPDVGISFRTTDAHNCRRSVPIGPSKSPSCSSPPPNNNNHRSPRLSYEIPNRNATDKYFGKSKNGRRLPVRRDGRRDTSGTCSTTVE